MSTPKEKKIFDIMKHMRRMKYRITNFFKYRLLANKKHMLLVGDRSHPLYYEIQKQFGVNWRIAQMGYYEKDEQNENENLIINLNDFSDQNGKIVYGKLQEIEKKISDFSKHYETIVFLGNQVTENESIFLSNDIEKHLDLHQRDIRAALIASNLACKFLYTNGMLVFAVNEECYTSDASQLTIQPQRAIRDCQLMQLGMVLAERDHMENDTLTLMLLMKDGLNSQWNNAIMKYLKLWSDGLKRPASGTFIQFKQSEYRKSVIYPDLI